MKFSSLKNQLRIAGLLGVLAISLFTGKVAAQDKIELRDGKILEAKVMEVLKKEVVYKKFSNPSGPNYRVKVDDIAIITYESGAVDSFNPVRKEDGKQNDEVNSLLFGNIPRVEEAHLGDNIVSMNVLDILFQNISLSYERIGGDKKRISLRFPVSVSMLGTSVKTKTISDQHQLFYSGLDFSFYPFGQGHARFLLGPSIRVGNVRSRYESWEIDSIGLSYPKAKLSFHPYASFMAHCGFSWNPVKGMTFQAIIYAGSRRYFFDGPDNLDIVPTAAMSLLVGYRF